MSSREETRSRKIIVKHEVKGSISQKGKKLNKIIRIQKTKIRRQENQEKKYFY